MQNNLSETTMPPPSPLSDDGMRNTVDEISEGTGANFHEEGSQEAQAQAENNNGHHENNDTPKAKRIRHNRKDRPKCPMDGCNRISQSDKLPPYFGHTEPQLGITSVINQYCAMALLANLQQQAFQEQRARHALLLQTLQQQKMIAAKEKTNLTRKILATMKVGAAASSLDGCENANGSSVPEKADDHADTNNVRAATSLTNRRVRKLEAIGFVWKLKPGRKPSEKKTQSQSQSPAPAPAQTTNKRKRGLCNGLEEKEHQRKNADANADIVADYNKVNEYLQQMDTHDFPPNDPPPTEPILEPLDLITENDFVCWGGERNRQIPGNQKVMKLVSNVLTFYRVSAKKQKDRITRSVVLVLRNRGIRFVRQDEEGRLYEVGDVPAISKVSQLFASLLDKTPWYLRHLDEEQAALLCSQLKQCPRTFVSSSINPVVESRSDLNSNDVLCGGKGTLLFKGNRSYRDLVRDMHPAYIIAKTQNKSSFVAIFVVKIIRSRGGRFLRREGDAFYEIGDDQSVLMALGSLDEKGHLRENGEAGKASDAVTDYNEVLRYLKQLDEGDGPPSVPPSTEPILQSLDLITEHDFVGGRINQTISGNEKIRKLVSNIWSFYRDSATKQKNGIQRSVVMIVRNRGGRFLRRDEEGCLYEMGDATARKKVSQLFRNSAGAIEVGQRFTFRAQDESMPDLHYQQITDNDVVSGKTGRRSMNLEGNKRYQSVLEHFQISYFSDKKTKRRKRIASTVVAEIKRRGGRILQTDPDGKVHEISQVHAEIFTYKALQRLGAPGKKCDGEAAVDTKATDSDEDQPNLPTPLKESCDETANRCAVNTGMSNVVCDHESFFKLRNREVGAEIPNDNQKFPRTKTAFHESPDPKEDDDEDDTEECWNDYDDEHYLLLLKHQESFLVTRCDQTSSSLDSAMKYDSQSSVQELTKRLSLFQSELTQVRERIEKLTRKSEDGSHYCEKRKTASEEPSEYVFV